MAIHTKLQKKHPFIRNGCFFRFLNYRFPQRLMVKVLLTIQLLLMVAKQSKKIVHMQFSLSKNSATNPKMGFYIPKSN